MSRGLALFALLALLPFATACGEAPPPPEEAVPERPEAMDPRTIDYADELGIDIDEMERTASGAYYRDDVVGDGEEAVTGRTAVVHYTGWLPDGRAFDSSRDRGQPFPVELGAGRVIQGWDDGVPGMREGGRRILVIPPELAYGATGTPGGPIPPNAVLIFDVELLEVR